MNTVYYVARYEDRAKIEREAKRLGWTDGDSSLMDHLDVNDIGYATVKRFNERRDAEEWLTSAIKAKKALWPVGDLIEYCTIRPGNRCDACTCNGERRERSWEVEEDGRHNEQHGEDCFA